MRAIMLLCCLALLGAPAIAAAPAAQLVGQVETTLSANAQTATPGDRVTLTLTVRNVWPDAEPLAARLDTPDGITIVAAHAPIGTTVLVGPQKAVWAGVVPAGATVTITAAARVEARAAPDVQTITSLASTNSATGLITPEVPGAVTITVTASPGRIWLPLIQREP